MAVRYILDSGVVKGAVEFDDVKDAILFAKTFGLVSESEDASEAPNPTSAENIHGVDVRLWNAIRGDTYRKALNAIIERSPDGITGEELATATGRRAQGIGMMLHALRKVGEKVGLAPDGVVRQRKQFIAGKQRTVVWSPLAVTK